MPKALQTIAGFATAAGAGVLAATPAAGDTFNVPSFALTAQGLLEGVYWSGTTADFIRVRSPRLHDANQGLRLQTGTSQRRRLLPTYVNDYLYPSDTPIVEIDATGAATNGVLLQYGYTDLPGVSPRLAQFSEIQSRIVHIMGCEVDVTSGALGQWGNGVALNANFDNFEAGADYALLGYTVNVGALGIAITGKDTGNLKVGGPCDPDAAQTQDYFIRFSEEGGIGYIPIIAANNKSSTLLQVVDVAAATAVHVSLLLAQLS
jgi:hypothetical protein